MVQVGHVDRKLNQLGVEGVQLEVNLCANDGNKIVRWVRTANVVDVHS